MVRNKEHKFNVSLLTELERLMDVFLDFEVQYGIYSWRWSKVSCRVLNSSICCLDITSEKRSVDSIVK